jgi:hypothetical protein
MNNLVKEKALSPQGTLYETSSGPSPHFQLKHLSPTTMAWIEVETGFHPVKFHDIKECQRYIK